MDYLVAARGYSLAVAFLVFAIAEGARFKARSNPVTADGKEVSCVVISCCMGLSFCANFSFAVVDFATAMGLFVWIGGTKPSFRTVAAFLLPGLVLAICLVGPVMYHWPHGELTWGAKSLGEMRRSVIDAALFEPNPYILNDWVLAGFNQIRRVPVPITIVVVLWRI